MSKAYHLLRIFKLRADKSIVRSFAVFETVPIVKKDSKEENKTLDVKKKPELRGTCCMSGCANCVWIQYAEDMVKYYSRAGNGIEEVFKAIDQEVDDDNLKAYLNFEIGFLVKKM